ncbi:MAG: hypothetical protein ACREJQ_04910, partial [bacterium]
MDALLAGYFEAGNLGDETYLSLLDEYARREGRRFSYLSRSSESHRGSGSRLSPIRYSDLRQIDIAICKSRCVIFPGGNVLQNRTSQRSLTYY